MGLNADAAVDPRDADADADAGGRPATADGSIAEAALGDGPAGDGPSRTDGSDGATSTSDASSYPCGVDGSAARDASNDSDRCDPACDPQPPKGGTNLVANSSFEVGAAGWSAPYGGAVTVSSTRFHCGRQSGAMLARQASFHVPGYALDLPPSTPFQYSFWVLQTGTADLPISLQTYSPANPTSSFGPAAFTLVSPNTWTRISGTYMPPAGRRVSQVFIVQASTNGVYPDLYFDDLLVIP